jgi:hypothetical protein
MIYLFKNIQLQITIRKKKTLFLHLFFKKIVLFTRNYRKRNYTYDVDNVKLISLYLKIVKVRLYIYLSTTTF